jgi:N-acyl-D-amino-acid deacylase
MFDYVIKGATVVDGSGRKPYVQDVAVKGQDIVRIGPIEEAESRRVIDATGKVVCPGFIDMHSHTDLEFFRPKPPDAKIRQGITTGLLGQDGLGTAPVAVGNRGLMAGLVAGLLGSWPDDYNWESFAEYMEALEKRRLPQNAAVLASHGPLRIAAMGMDDRPATPFEIRRMKSLLRETLEEGAFGFSTGLIYPPCSYSTTEELIELNREVSPYGGLFVVHQRDEGYNLLRSFEEVSRVAKDSGVHLHISHLQAFGKVNWPLMAQLLEKVELLRKEGPGISWDRYPYLAGSTVLMAVLPTWTLSQGTEALIRNLREPDFRKRIHAEYQKGLDVWHNRSISVGWDNIVVSAVASEHNKWMEGKTCAELAHATGKDPVDFVCDLLAEERLAVTMISHYGSPDVLRQVLSHPCATVGSDGIFGGRPHPRLYGSFPRFLGRYVRDEKVLAMEEAVRKITGFPAELLGLTQRGQVKEGYRADLVVLDWGRLCDTATYEEPHSYPEGIDYVFVNGIPVVEGGVFSGQLPGQVLRKGRR